MTAAQSVNSSVQVPLSGERSTGGATKEQGGAAFDQALESAAHSSRSHAGEGKFRSSGRDGGRDAGGSGDEANAGAQSGMTTGLETASAAGLFELFRTLGASAGAERVVPAGVAADGLGAAGRPSAFGVLGLKSDGALAPEDGSAEGGPWLPGLVNEDGETIDTARLVPSMEVVEAVDPKTPAATTIKVKVTAQETHLALGPRIPEMGDAFKQTPDDGAAAALRGEAKPLVNDVLPSVAAEQSGDSDVRVRAGASAAGEPELPHQTAAGRFATAQGDGGDGAGSDGRRQDGRGAPGAGSTQSASGSTGGSSSNVFAANLQGLGAHGLAVQSGGVAAQAHEPVSDQIAAQIRAEVRADGLGEQSSEGVVKVIELELKPANLGPVTVRLALKDNMITVHIESQRPETLSLIERERQMLASTLSSAGYTVDAITAAPQSEASRMGGQSSFADQGQGSMGSQGNGAAQAQGQAGSGQASSDSGQGRSGQNQHDDRAGRGYGSKADGEGGVRNGADGLYV